MTAPTVDWDDEQGTAIWEPVIFRVGDGVVVGLSGECDVEWGTVPSGHPDIFQGVAGRIVGVYSRDDPRRPWARTHPYGVEFAHAIFAVDYWWDGGYFAAAELVPADGADEQPTSGRC